MLAHLLAPLVDNALLEAWQAAALSKLRHELLAVLPLVKRAELCNLALLVLAQVEEGRRVANLPQPGHLVLLFDLEQGQVLAIAVPFHLVSEGGKNDCCGLAAWAEVAEDLHDALVDCLVVEDLLLEVVGADALREHVRLEALRLVVVL